MVNNFDVLAKILKVVPGNCTPCVWLSKIIQSINGDLQGRLFPTFSERTLTAVTINEAAKISASQGYLRKLCRGRTTSKNKPLKILKGMCTNINRTATKEIPQYPRDDEVGDGDDDGDEDPNDPDANPDAYEPLIYDVLLNKMPQFMKNWQQGHRDAVVSSFCDRLAADQSKGLAARPTHSEQDVALRELAEEHRLTLREATTILEHLPDLVHSG